MKRTIFIVGLVCLSATGCQTPNQTNGAVAGGVAGGLLGLGVGALTRNPAAGLAIGAGSAPCSATRLGPAGIGKTRRRRRHTERRT